ncbi:dTMP kinase, partial [Prochlorococcus sp. AH-736-K09]|nr:dTMP kinase [Prochlorococcus sp. AH-736-K09]
MKGKFIVIEGIDGCGKTTQIRELSRWLPDSGLMNKNSKLITTREPGGSQLGKKLRTLILDNNKSNKPSALAELLLYSADRAEHVSKIISPALKSKDWVLSDRFADSTLAYQGYGRNINLETIKNIESIVCQGETPDLTIFLEISPEESILRRKNEIPDRIESEG